MNKEQLAKIDSAIEEFNTEVEKILNSSNCDNATISLVEEIAKQSFYTFRAFRKALSAD